MFLLTLSNLTSAVHHFGDKLWQFAEADCSKFLMIGRDGAYFSRNAKHNTNFLFELEPKHSEKVDYRLNCGASQTNQEFIPSNQWGRYRLKIDVPG
jgi:hypothetical protein